MSANDVQTGFVPASASLVPRIPERPNAEHDHRMITYRAPILRHRKIHDDNADHTNTASDFMQSFAHFPALRQ